MCCHISNVEPELPQVTLLCHWEKPHCINLPCSNVLLSVLCSDLFFAFCRCSCEFSEFQNLVSWAGVSYERGRPTLPRPIRPSEAEKFGLNQWKQPPDEGPTEYTVKDIQKYINRKDISALPPEDEEDILDLEVAQAVQKVYKGLKTGDIVRVTANNTFRDDVAVVRKLEDGMATLELYRYGDKQITTMKPQEVSKLSTVDILKRLSPKQPFIENQRGRNFIHRNYVPIKDEYDRFRSGKKKSPTSDFGMDFGDDELFSAGNSWSMAPGRSFRQHQQALSGNPGTDNSWGPSEGISDIPNRSQRQSPPKGASHMLPPPPKNPAKTTSNQYLESFQSDLEQALKDLPASFKEGAPPHGKGSVQPQGNLQSRPQSKLFWDLQNKWRQADELNESTNESNYGTRESDSLKTADHGVQSEGPEDEEKREDAFLDNLIKDLEQYTLSPSSQDVEKEEATSAAASNDMSMEDLEKHSVTELKEMLRKKGLRVSGRKAELISRLAGN